MLYNLTDIMFFDEIGLLPKYIPNPCKECIIYPVCDQTRSDCSKKFVYVLSAMSRSSIIWKHRGYIPWLIEFYESQIGITEKW